MMDTHSADTTMANLIVVLFKARDVAHMWHWKVKSFSIHMALGELYNGLLELSDELMEMYMGKYGTSSHLDLSYPNPFSEQDPLQFIGQLCQFIDSQEAAIPQEGFLVNKFQELQELAYTTKYKMENLK